jgi:uncharacterized protein (AIM24 family)
MMFHNLYLQLKRMESAIAQANAMQKERDSMLAKTFYTLHGLLIAGKIEEATEEIANLHTFYRDRAAKGN